MAIYFINEHSKLKISKGSVATKQKSQLLSVPVINIYENWYAASLQLELHSGKVKFFFQSYDNAHPHVAPTNLRPLKDFVMNNAW